MQLNKFSIALPVYNGGELLKLCIQSLLSQTYPFYQVYIFNSSNNSDGSTEYLTSLCNSKITIIQAIKPLTIEQNWARFAAELPPDSYGTIIGQDDLYAPTFLEKMNETINEFPDASLWQSHFQFIDGKGKVIRSCNNFSAVEAPEIYLQNVLTSKVDSVGTGYIFRTNDYKKIGGIPLYPSLLFADIALWLKLTDISYKANNEESLYFFRKHDSTTSLSAAVTYYQGFKCLIDFFVEFGKKDKKYEEVIKKYLADYVTLCIEIISFKIIRAKKMANKTVNTLSVSELLEDVKTKSDICSFGITPSASFKTKILSVIDDSPLLLRLYQYLKGI